MANEATIRTSLSIKTGDLEYHSTPTAFQADVAGIFGPAPGALAVSTVGTDIDLSEFTTPGLARFQNLDTLNYVEYGIWDPETTTFYPLGELLPGETYVLRLSKNLAFEYGTGPGTGTTGPETNRLRFKANAQSCNVLVEVFEV